METNRQHILIVDDDKQIQDLIATFVKREGYKCSLAGSGEQALSTLEETPIELMISDIDMEGMTGVELLKMALNRYPDLAVIMVTGISDRETAIETLHMGAYGYITKPFHLNELVINITNALRRRQLEIENRRHREELEMLVEERTRELFKSREESIQILSKAAEFRDDETAKHTIRMGRFCEQLALLQGLSKTFCYKLKNAAPLHDVGKIGISDAILLKPGKLTPEEFEVIKTHCEIGYRILSESTSDILLLGAEIALTHHEKYDGSGYPRGLVGDEIPISGRLAAVCDVFDALTSNRVYNKAISVNKALEIIREGRGKHFDPGILDNFVNNIDLITEIQSRYAD
jgi:putative two-component system response regulator